MTYHYKESGLNNIYLINGYEIIEENNGSYISFNDLHGLHQAIASRLVHQAKPLTGKEFRFLRTEMDMSQNTLSGCFGVTEQTVARWEKGQTEIPRTSDVSLRSMYLESIKHESNISALLSQIAENEGTMAKLEFEMDSQNKHWKSSQVA